MASESLSLEETNKVRISLGLAPLVDDDGGDNADGAGEAQEVEEDQDSIAEANWAERRAADRRAREEKETKERLAKARNQRELRAKLEGKGLGSAEGTGAGDDDEKASAAEWIKKSRKAAKARAAELEKLKAREKELEERDRDAMRYGENDLAGLKVGHGLEDFEEGKDVILTLKDNKVLEDGDDELQNINLAEYARTADRLDLQKRGKTAYKYTGFDDDEFDAFTQGKERGVLSKYDEVLGESSSRSGEGFRLGESSTSASAATAGDAPSTSRRVVVQSEEEKQKQLRRELLSLDYTKTEQVDYLQEGDVGFKKPKKKKKRTDKGGASSSRRVAAFDGDDEEITAHANGNGNGDGDVDMHGDDEEDKKPKIPTAERRLVKEGGLEMDGGVIDDEDMQAALARQRRAANKKRVKIMRGEDLARQLLEEQQQQSTRAGSTSLDQQNGEDDDMGAVPVKKEEDVDDEEEDDSGLVLDDTTEFIRNISARSAIAKRENANRATAGANATPLDARQVPRVKSEPKEDGDVPLDEMDVKHEDPEEGEAVSDEEMEGTHHYDRETSTLSEGGKPSTSRLSRSIEPEPGTRAAGKGKEVEGEEAWGSTATEKHHSGGLANTLALLKSSGEVKALTPEERERERAYKEREKFMNELKKAEMAAEAEKARNRATGNTKDQAQREYENKQRAYNMAQRQIEAFKNYKPNVEINYTDEFGRDLTPKEAWKHLSHKFHGKGSGTNKREKLLKKIEDERKREAMSAGDTPLGTNAAFKARQERTGSATMILGVGNRNAAPSADTLLGSSAGKASLDISKNKAGQSTSGTSKRKRTEPKVLG